MPSYSNERGEAVVAKLLPPRNLSVREIAQQEEISKPTVYKWRKEAREQGRCLPNAHYSVVVQGRVRGGAGRVRR